MRVVIRHNLTAPHPFLVDTKRVRRAACATLELEERVPDDFNRNLDRDAERHGGGNNERVLEKGYVLLVDDFLVVILRDTRAPRGAVEVAVRVDASAPIFCRQAEAHCQLQRFDDGRVADHCLEFFELVVNKRNASDRAVRV